MKKRVFLRQSFTESGNREQEIIQEAINLIKEQASRSGHEICIVTGDKALSKTDFKSEFERRYNRRFTPGNFREVRLELLENSDMFIIVRTGLSESTSFEVAYNIFNGNRIPMLFLIWDQAPIKTTLIKDLEDFCDVEYITFTNLDEVKSDIRRFIAEN